MIELNNKPRVILAVRTIFGKTRIQKLVYVKKVPNGAMFKHPGEGEHALFFIPIGIIRKDYFDDPY